MRASQVVARRLEGSLLGGDAKQLTMVAVKMNWSSGIGLRVEAKFRRV